MQYLGSRRSAEPLEIKYLSAPYAT
jgi:hypothetical protein